MTRLCKFKRSWQKNFLQRQLKYKVTIRTNLKLSLKVKTLVGSLGGTNWATFNSQIRSHWVCVCVLENRVGKEMGLVY